MAARTTKKQRQLQEQQQQQQLLERQQEQQQQNQQQQQQQDSPPEDSATAARIRNNQRRSRARHREFVEDLKARLHEYERRGVEATLEMRQAARAVALENSRLRALLASRGVANDDVDRYLASFPDNEQSPVMAYAQGQHPITADLLQYQLPPIHVQPAAIPPSTTWITSSDKQFLAHPQPMPDMFVDRCMPMQSLEVNPLAVLAHASAQQQQQQQQQLCCGPLTQCSGGMSDSQHHDPRHTVEPPPPLSETTDSERSPTPNPHEMTCSNAAYIMTTMSRYASEELAREALGCYGKTDCLVKNTTLFELLDGLGAG